MDLIEWDLIRDTATEAHWVAVYHVRGWDPATSQYHARELAALCGPLTPAQAVAAQLGDDLAWLAGLPSFRDREAARRCPARYDVVAHLGDTVLEEEERG